MLKVNNEKIEKFFIKDYNPLEIEFYLNGERLSMPDSFNCFDIQLKPVSYIKDKKSDHHEFQEIEVLLKKKGVELSIATMNIFSSAKERKIKEILNKISELKESKKDVKEEKKLQNVLLELKEQTGFKLSSLGNGIRFRERLNKKLTQEEYDCFGLYPLVKIEEDLPFFLKHKNEAQAKTSCVDSYEKESYIDGIQINLENLWDSALWEAKDFKLVMNFDLFLQLLEETFDEKYSEFFK